MKSGGSALIVCQDANSARAEAYGVWTAMRELWAALNGSQVEHRCDSQGVADMFESLGKRTIQSWRSTADAGLWWQIWWLKQRWAGKYTVLWVRSHIEKRKENRSHWSRHESVSYTHLTLPTKRIV
eukprot:TRINITY_DN54588_c0_g1_i1.p1 TRINITY_DN54588_c0_g1~~TRINITY_DN54588_c0_g1_i1.p1  ORF type:complete len:126 (-),score=17.33 TRINITY_DN54588_c0_g1_i1:44-421(-)